MRVDVQDFDNGQTPESERFINLKKKKFIQVGDSENRYHAKNLISKKKNAAFSPSSVKNINKSNRRISKKYAQKYSNKLKNAQNARGNASPVPTRNINVRTKNSKNNLSTNLNSSYSKNFIKRNQDLTLAKRQKQASKYARREIVRRQIVKESRKTSPLRDRSYLSATPNLASKLVSGIQTPQIREKVPEQ
jgi:hypothetical protein